MKSAMATVGHAPAGRDVHRSRTRRTLLTCSALMAVSLAPTEADAQRDRRLGGVPRDVALEVTRIFNAPGTRRVRGDFSLAATDTVRGDLAILNGNARLAGVVRGDVVVLNGDVFLADGAHLDRSLTVLGGAFEAPDRPMVMGDIRVWSSRYRYKEEGDSLVAETDFFARWSRWVRDEDDTGTQSQLFVTTAHTYNRVEGLPIFVGPRVRARAGDTRVRAEVFGIFRTGDGIEWTRENLGHRAMLEVRQGNRAGVAVGGRLFDEVDAMEKWQLTDGEVGLNSFLFTRDYRDYWQRHGGLGYVSLYVGESEVRASYGEERWSARRTRDPWTLFNSDLRWRRNPVADEGVLKIFTLSGTLDTRTNNKNPRSGWYLRGELERGTGVLDAMGELTPGVRSAPPAAEAPLNQGITYSRALFDLRRYNRLGPNAQLNLRAVFGGWVNGDALPVQRRLAISGLDALPGFDFRRMEGTSDIGTCATGDEGAYEALGRPAQCERMALLQVEWKGDFRINLFGDDSDYGDRRWGIGRVRADGTWVLFANTGRGWLIDRPGPSSVPQPDLGGLVYGKNQVPGFDSWRTDVGGGFDFGDFGVYIAQAVSQSGLSPNVYVRLSRRF